MSVNDNVKAFAAHLGTVLADLEVGGSASILYVTPEQFGASEDSPDNTSAIQTMLDTGKPVHWGTGRYELMGVLTVDAPANWTSNGAELVYTGATAESFVTFSGEVAVNSRGPLTIDSNHNAYCSVRVTATQTGRVQFENLTVKNTYRSGTLYLVGDGILIEGPLDQVFLSGVRVEDTRVAAGATVAGVSGAFGITVKATDDGHADTVSLFNCTVDGVYSEDPSYYADQDGVRLFTSEDDTVALYTTRFVIDGCTFVNCRNRSVKSQCEYGTVTNSQFIRTTGWIENSVPRLGQYEIDFQVGGGSVTNCEFHYETFAPSAICSFQGTRDSNNSGKRSLGGSLRNCKVFLNSVPTMDRLIAFNPRMTTDLSVVVSDLSVLTVSSEVESVVKGVITGTSGTTSVSVQDFHGPVSQALVNLLSTGNAQVYIARSTNTGALDVAPVVHLGSSTVSIHTSGMRGVTLTGNGSGSSVETETDRIDFTVGGNTYASLNNDAFTSFGVTISDLSVTVPVPETAGEIGEIGFTHGGLFYSHNDRLTDGVMVQSPIYSVTLSGGINDGLHFDVNAGTRAASFESSGDLVLNFPVELARYSVATLPSPGQAGRVVHVEDGNGGLKCLGVSDGSKWLRIPLGAEVSVD